jgi:hypothetical protein
VVRAPWSWVSPSGPGLVGHAGVIRTRPAQKIAVEVRQVVVVVLGELGKVPRGEPAAAAGMRQGELLALKWEDVDLEDGRLRVRRTLTHVDKAFDLGEPKTKNSRRSMRLTKGTISALQAHLTGSPYRLTSLASSRR